MGVQARQIPAAGQTLERVIDAQVRAVDEGSRQVELSFSSEFPVPRWGELEILSHDQGAVDMKRLLQVGTVLFDHGKDVRFGKLPVAKIDEAWVDTDRKGRAKVTFDEDPDSDLIFQKVKKHFLQGISVRYEVDSWEEVAPGKMSSNGRFTGPAFVALKWAPTEISFEPVPADPSVGVGRSADEPPKLGEECNQNIAFLETQLKHNKNYL